MLRENGIQQELVVELERNIRAEAMVRLTYQPPNTRAVQRRRASVASTSLFGIGNSIREAGFDHFQKIPRSNQVTLGAEQASNKANEKMPTSPAMVTDDNPIHQINFGASTSGTSKANHSDDNTVDKSTTSTAIVAEQVDESYETDDEYDEKQQLIETSIASVPDQNDFTDPFGEYIESLYIIEPNNGNANEELNGGLIGAIQSDTAIDGYESYELDESLNIGQLFEEQQLIELLIEPSTAQIEEESNDGIIGTIQIDAAVAANPDPAVEQERKEDAMDHEIFDRSLFNDFQPFQRLPNLPFSLSGRPRAMSVDSHIQRHRRLSNSCLVAPSLDTIFEEENDDILEDVKHLFD